MTTTDLRALDARVAKMLGWTDVEWWSVHTDPGPHCRLVADAGPATPARGEPLSTVHAVAGRRCKGAATKRAGASPRERRTMGQYRHGDILIERVDGLPKGARLRASTGRVVLAEGEVTGHAHRIERADVAELYDADRGETYLRVAESTGVVHEEHARIALEPGVYRIHRQREYSPEAIRQVLD